MDDIWRRKYLGILREFGYSEERDAEAARALDAILAGSPPERRLSELIRGRTVFVLGAGPSLRRAVEAVQRFPRVPRIVADGALAALEERGAAADVVVTDLDGDLEALRRAGASSTILVVHAHGDNVERLELARDFVNCLGTAQSGECGSVRCFGGFTDGDRAVFLADHFGAARIIMLGMDFGSRIGRYSFTARRDRAAKLRKLRAAQRMLEWLASLSGSEILTTSKPMPGIERIRYRDLGRVLAGGA